MRFHFAVLQGEKKWRAAEAKRGGHGERRAYRLSFLSRVRVTGLSLAESTNEWDGKRIGLTLNLQ